MYNLRTNLMAIIDSDKLLRIKADNSMCGVA